MSVIAHKKREILSYRSFKGRKSLLRIAHILAAFIYCAASTAAAADSETWHYGLDNVGNITSRGLDPVPENATHSYIYDGLYRLTNETNPNNTDQYDYDLNSNRTGFTRDGSATTYQIDTNSNRLDQVGSDPRTYDNTGNTKTDRNGIRVFTYNKAGRLSQVHENGQLLASYTYNAQGQRSIKTTPGGTTYYLYDGSGQLLGEYDETGQPIKEYVHLAGEPIAQLEASKITYLHADHLATPRKATNEAGDVVWKWDSEAFGNKAPESSGGTTVNMRFPGQYYDEESGLYYNYFRYYDPETGRYITSDPIGLDGGYNTYAYVNGNPLKFIDVFGLDEQCEKCPYKGRYEICCNGWSADNSSITNWISYKICKAAVDKSCNITYNQIACCEADLLSCHKENGPGGAVKCEAEFILCKGRPLGK